MAFERLEKDRQRSTRTSCKHPRTPQPRHPRSPPTPRPHATRPSHRSRRAHSENGGGEGGSFTFSPRSCCRAACNADACASMICRACRARPREEGGGRGGVCGCGCFMKIEELLPRPGSGQEAVFGGPPDVEPTVCPCTLCPGEFDREFRGPGRSWLARLHGIHLEARLREPLPARAPRQASAGARACRRAPRACLWLMSRQRTHGAYRSRPQEGHAISKKARLHQHMRDRGWDVPKRPLAPPSFPVARGQLDPVSSTQVPKLPPDHGYFEQNCFIQRRIGPGGPSSIGHDLTHP